jgi:hypothetical protein
MIQLGVTEMPRAYILIRWTWSAEDNLVEELPGQPAIMPEESRRKMALAVMCNEFKTIPNYASQTEDDKKIVRNHLKAMKKDLANLKRETEKRAKKASVAKVCSKHISTDRQPNAACTTYTAKLRTSTGKSMSATGKLSS